MKKFIGKDLPRASRDKYAEGTITEEVGRGTENGASFIDYRITNITTRMQEHIQDETMVSQKALMT
jgi:hypothetical protein